MDTPEPKCVWHDHELFERVVVELEFQTGNDQLLMFLGKAGVCALANVSNTVSSEINMWRMTLGLMALHLEEQ